MRAAASSCGSSSSCITTCGTTTSPRSRCSATSRSQGVPVPAVIQATKTGMLYVFERTRGQPLFPISRAAGAREPCARRAGVADAAVLLAPRARLRRRRCTPMTPGGSRSGTAASAAISSLRYATRASSRRPTRAARCSRPATSAASTGAAWRSMRSTAHHRRRQSPAHGGHAAHAAGARARSALGELSALRVRPPGGHPLRHAPRAAALALGPAVHARRPGVRS